jgi:hypothetical protein
MDRSIDRMRAVRTDRYKYIRNYFPMIPYMQHNEYKEQNYTTWNRLWTIDLSLTNVRFQTRNWSEASVIDG